MSLLLVDKSALMRGLVNVDVDEELCLCSVIRLELLYSARSPADYERKEADLAEYRDLPVNAETHAIAETAQRELATISQHRVPVPDLLIAACAQQHGADVLHVDKHYDTLARVLNFRSVWAA